MTKLTPRQVAQALSVPRPHSWGRRFVLRACCLALFCIPSRAEIIDRIAVTVNNRPITESQIMDEIRVTAFLNGEKPDFGPANRRRTAERMVEQTLFRGEMEFTHYAGQEVVEIEEDLKAAKSRFAGEAEFERALRTYGIDANQLNEALTRQAAVLQFIELRFRPQVQVAEEEVKQYYTSVLVPEYQRKHSQPPPFEEARDQCEEALAQQQVDKLVDVWLKEMKAQARIRYTEEAFQ